MDVVMGRIWIAIGALSGCVAVAAGAFGAHALKKSLSPDMMDVFELAARYQMVHALALLAVGLWTARLPSPATTVAGWAFTAGTIVFSGSLYTLALTGATQLGMVTPFGGAAFLVGWLALAAGAMRKSG